MSAFSCERAASSVLDSARSLVCVPVFHVERGGWIPALNVLSFGHVTGVRTLALHFLSNCVSARSRVRSAPRTLVHVCFVVLHAVCVSIGCVHLCCHVLCEHGAYEFSSLAACINVLFCHMAGDLFAGHVLVLSVLW